MTLLERALDLLDRAETEDEITLAIDLVQALNSLGSNQREASKALRNAIEDTI